MRATWYLLEDGTAVDPADCTHNADGYSLTHKSGAAVAMAAPDCPKTTGVDIDENGAKKPDESPAKITEDMKPEKKPAKPRGTGYKTRDA